MNTIDNGFINKLSNFSDGDLLLMADILEEINSLVLDASGYSDALVSFWEDLQKHTSEIPGWKSPGGFFKDLSEFLTLQSKEEWDDRSREQWLSHLRSWFTDHDSLSLKVIQEEPEIQDQEEEEKFEFTEQEENQLDYSGLIEDHKILETYIQEASEFLDNAQFALLDMEYSTADSESINTVFRCFHTIKSSSAFLGIKNVEVLAHYMENMLGLVRKGELSVSGDLVDLLFFGIGFLRDMVQSIAAADFKKEKITEALKSFRICSFVNLIEQIVKQHKNRKLGQILKDMGKMDSALINKILKSQSNNQDERKFGEIAVEEKIISRDDLEEAVKEQEKSRLQSSFVRVSAERLNTLVDMVGELVVNQSMLHEQLNQEAGKVTERSLQQLETITTTIKNIALSMGMVPISETFQKLRVVVRNTARELGKTISFDMSGEDTELDRKLIEAVYDPLVHIVRNSVSHGIELPDEREKLGKNSLGKIHIAARHKGNGIEISVKDDGGGINLESVFNKALKMGLVQENERAAYLEQPRKCYSLLFKAGFSTKAEADAISGRGVGLDVVMNNLQKINGKVDIVSETGKGSSFSIKLPLTLAIIDGFVMEVKGERFIIPFNVIDEILVPEDVEINILDNGVRMVRFRDRFVPVLDLRTLFGKNADPSEERFVYILISFDDTYYALAVDKVLGKQEIVIKNLNEVLRRQNLFSGGTIFGDGSIGFILDLEEIIADFSERL